ncbi:MAG: trypsin-like peptidase domain-containing protein, partial [Kangiellaceae bacterium]|nr:trypsin-like peptidase domain-containing protein [Kangiellaceae bacterium]
MKKYLLISLLIVCNTAVNAIESNRWKTAMKKVDNAVISIKINAVRAFDTEGNKTTQATGFVVDAERGIILTNRHVVNPGPITAKGIFSNREEVKLIPIYRDPIHDFGFFKYDPKALTLMRPEALKLAPRTAQPGDEIRVVGNDSGEHMSILSATLARLDRAAPKYGAGGYSDFNTFYFQSAADTSGGSSGSPVINDKAEVLALNAGGQFGSASSYFLPLYKITRALKAIQNDQDVARGTIQTTLNYQTYDEVKRLGLTSDIESKIREHNSGSGILTVSKVVKDGPTHNLLKPGDIILSLKSDSEELSYVTRYETFEIFLDEHVGQNIELQVFRQDKVLTKIIKVQDLHSITPSEYLEVAGGIFNNVSYQIARQSNLAIKGVFVAVPGFMFGNYGVPRGAIIQQLNGNPINDIDDLTKALSELSQGQFFNIKYVTQRSPLYASVASIKFQTNWHISNQCHRNDQTGLWPCEKISWNKQSIKEKVTEVKFKRYSDKNTNRIAPSLVWINSDLPYHLDGQRFSHYSGTGLILDSDSGLVVADRNTVPINMLQVTITVAGVAEIPAKV